MSMHQSLVFHNYYSQLCIMLLCSSWQPLVKCFCYLLKEDIKEAKVRDTLNNVLSVFCNNNVCAIF